MFVVLVTRTPPRLTRFLPKRVTNIAGGRGIDLSAGPICDEEKAAQTSELPAQF
jgi:hypothetical protein